MKSHDSIMNINFIILVLTGDAVLFQGSLAFVVVLLLEACQGSDT